MRGQALVEFALILPVMLLLILGTLQIGIALIARYELGHAVSEAAVAGAIEPAQPRRCVTALAALVTIYGRETDDAKCVPAVGNALEVSASINLPLFIPGWDSWRIAVTERAIVR